MMKTHMQGGRSTSNSAQASSRLKKSNSSTSNKLKNSITSSSATIESSLKMSRPNPSSRSNKKTPLNSNHSNKSFKTLNETHSQSHLQVKKTIPRKIQAVISTTDKRTAVPIKNMKQKALGNQALGGNHHNLYKGQVRNTEEKENDGQSRKKCISHQQKQLFINDKQSRRPMREKTNQSLLNFSSMLVPREGEELSLSQFEIGRKLGKGRFGDVYMARDLRTGLVLAIKMINKKEVKEAGMENQVTQEIKVQMFTNHPNILKMYGFFSDHSKIYLLLELATHGCLFKEIRKRNFCEESLASFYFRQVAGAVRYLHSHYVIHRDIKPENILNSFSVLKLCDFGWAAYSPLYQRQTFCGTLDYVPPQIVTGDFYDERADLWCLGVLCYELTTGKAPFESKVDENQTYDKILKVDIQFPLYLSAQVADFIGKILNRDPNKRMGLQQIETHEWMRRYQNQPGRMIPKEIWDAWTRVAKGE